MQDTSRESNLTRMEISHNIESNPPHICGNHCLGPLSFHKGALGARLSLSLGARHVERDRETFRNGLAFTSRPITVREKIHLRVERCDQHWIGGLRLGFTSIPPSSFGGLFPPAMAIPDLTTTPGYWAADLPPNHAMPGKELRFWMTYRGMMVYEGADGVRYQKLLDGVDVTQPLWAMVDVYGQTRAVLLLRSEKKSKLKLWRSCPVLPPPAVSEGDSCMCVRRGRPCCTPQDDRSLAPHITTQPDTPADQDSAEECAVCLSAARLYAFPCGHRCLCAPCSVRVTNEFGSCPLCRRPIRNSSDDETPAR